MVCSSAAEGSGICLLGPETAVTHARTARVPDRTDARSCARVSVRLLSRMLPRPFLSSFATVGVFRRARRRSEWAGSVSYPLSVGQKLLRHYLLET